MEHGVKELNSMVGNRTSLKLFVTVLIVFSGFTGYSIQLTHKVQNTVIEIKTLCTSLKESLKKNSCEIAKNKEEIHKNEVNNLNRRRRVHESNDN